MNRKTFKILGVKVDEISLAEAKSKLKSLAELNQKSIVTTINTEFVMGAQTDRQFRDILNNKSQLNLPDSFGMFWAGYFLSLKSPRSPYLKFVYLFSLWLLSIVFMPFAPKMFKTPIKEKISGSDFIWSIAKIAAENKYKLFLFGGAATVAERAALKLQTDVYDLRVAGVYPGDMTKPTEEIIEAINRSRADILLVCLGAPLQEKWLTENLSKTACKVGIGLGGTFDFVAQIIPRAPLWMQRSGLEWLFRLITNPRRFKRQLSVPKFMLKVLTSKLNEKFS